MGNEISRLRSSNQQNFREITARVTDWGDPYPTTTATAAAAAAANTTTTTTTTTPIIVGSGSSSAGTSGGGRISRVLGGRDRKTPRGYLLPANLSEWYPGVQEPSKNSIIEKSLPSVETRFSMAHTVGKTLFGLFKSPIHDVLESGGKVLDVGCGAGNWSYEVAGKYPRSTVYGVEQNSKSLGLNSSQRPSNFIFTEADIHKPLPYPDKHFDLVYSRFMLFAHNRDQWRALIPELVRITKPGGYLELAEPDLGLINSGPLYAHLYQSLSSILEEGPRIDPSLGRHLEPMLSDLSDLVFVTSGNGSAPIGWNGNIGEIAKTMIGLSVFMSLAAILAVPMGLTEDGYVMYVKSSFEECQDLKAYINGHWVYGQKSSF